MQVSENFNESLFSYFGGSIPEAVPSPTPSSFSGFEVRCNGPLRTVEFTMLFGGPDSGRRRVCIE